MKSFCVLESFTMYITLLILRNSPAELERDMIISVFHARKLRKHPGFKDTSMLPD